MAAPSRCAAQPTANRPADARRPDYISGVTVWALTAGGGLLAAAVGLLLFELAGGVETESETLAGLGVTLIAGGLLVMVFGLVVLVATAVARLAKRHHH